MGESTFISKETGAFLDSIFEQGEPNQILVTQTVKYLLLGAGLSFSQHKKPVFEPVSGEPHFLFAVDDEMSTDVPSSNFQIDQLSKNNSFLETVLQCIDVHMEDELFGVEKLCKEIGISDRQLQRKLKAITSKSPNQLISSVRLHRAKELLLLNNHNIAEVAYQTGFSNPSYFSKSFKKEFGITPSELINKAN